LTIANQYPWQTYPEALQAAGVDWKWYFGPGTNTGQALYTYMQQYQAAQPGSPLYERALTPSPLVQFEYDALHDRLPTVSWLFPPVANDEHPSRSPAAGATFIASAIDAIASNPDVWAKTAFILSYDENDGLFDHVQPPTPPTHTPQEFVSLTSPGGTPGGNLPVGRGFRVPAIIVSPWTAGGYVCSEAFDHTSQLMFLEKFTGVKAINISDYRRQTLGDLTSAFRFNAPNYTPPVLPDTSGQALLAQYTAANLPLPVIPGSEQSAPTQEKGKRRHVG